MSTGVGMMEVVKGSPERLTWGWGVVFSVFGLGILAVLSFLIANLPETERTMVGLGLTMAAIVFCTVGWIEQERSTTSAWGLSFVGVSLGAAVLDGTQGARVASWLIAAVGNLFIDVFILTISAVS
jgi:hypothetical protein